MNIEKEGAAGRIFLLLSAVLAMSGAFLGSKTLAADSVARPIKPDNTKPTTLTPEDNQPASHPWNDPFDSTLWQKQKESSFAPLDFSQEEADTQIDVRLLYCLLDGDAFPENVDDRRRARVAVHAAMHSLEYAPESPLRLKMFRYSPRKTENLPIAYDRFSRTVDTNDCTVPPKRKKESIVCLYVNEDTLGDKPLTALQDLHKYLLSLPPVPRIFQVQTDLDPKIRVLGPTNSVELRKFLKEATDPTCNLLDSATSIHCFATAASIGWERLLTDIPCEKRDRVTAHWGPGFKFYLDAVPVYINRPPSDSELCESLARELYLRSVLVPKYPAAQCKFEPRKLLEHFILAPTYVMCKLPGPIANLVKPEKPRIVLIAEQDSHYGRALEREFRESVNNKYECINVETYWFPRGLDGYTPEDRGKYTGRGTLQADPKPVLTAAYAPPTVDPRMSAGHASKAHGDAMLDYLERLRIELELSETRQLGKGRIAAVGILCNDVFDKISILRALRPAFSDTWFFTTDLDAQFMQRENLPFTHNLIVASASGISTAAEPQIYREHSAQFPFRSSAQMSFYAGTHALLSPPPLAPRAERARVFELGLSGPVYMSEGNQELTGLKGWAMLFLLFFLAAVLFPHPTNPTREVLSTCINFLLSKLPATKPGASDPRVSAEMTSTGATALRDNSNDDPRKRRQEPPLRFPGAAFQYIAVLMIGLCFMYLSVYRCITLMALPDEEPFSWNAGISVWPTELFRSALIALCMLWYARIVYRQSEQVIEIESAFPDLVIAPQQSTVDKANFTHEERPGQSPKRAPIAIRNACRKWILPSFKGIVMELVMIFRPDWRFKSCKTSLECWRSYRQAIRACFTLVRCTFMAYLITVIQLALLSPALGSRHVPIRGLHTADFDYAITALLTFSLSMLASVVVDASIVSASAMRFFEEKESDWKLTIAKKYPGLAPNKALERLLDMIVVGRITDTVLRHSYLPYMLLVGTMFSRVFFFDNWNWSPFVLQFFAFFFLTILASEYLLASHCDRLRARALTHAEECLITTNETNRDLTNEIVRQVRGLQTGGFRSFADNPIAKAVLVPLGGAGAVGLLQYLTLWSW